MPLNAKKTEKGIMICKEHKVGERFKKDGITYEIKESIHCQECALLTGENGCLADEGEGFEECSRIFREDKKSVIFVQVGEAKK